MFGLGFQEVLLLALIALLVFGAAKLPDIGRALGRMFREFKQGMDGDDKTPEDKTGHGAPKQP
jgi:sec-independent protein translocase protein TatA